MNQPMGILVLHPEDAIGVLARTIMALPCLSQVRVLDMRSASLLVLLTGEFHK